MTDTFEFTLDNPLTEEQWDMIADVDFDHTDRIWFHTKHGKEVEFTKVRHGKWIIRYEPGTEWYMITCSECGENVTSEAPCIGFLPNAKVMWDYCPYCGARMDEE